ncbi:MAG TPA: substrate-binding domain-containing protein [Burkholderiaceae bacterium]|nr:substrate-binding domain-containing protein [Burkholderiaceae bacterium]
MHSTHDAYRRRLLQAAAVAVGTAGIARHGAAQPKEFKVGMMIALSGPASLFGPTQRACAELAADQINQGGGIAGRPVRLLFADAGGPPADTARSAVRLMLDEKVDCLIGSHDSATREAVVTTVKGRTPYIYTPVYEGGDCSPNLYCLGETPPQQAQPATDFLVKQRNAKSFFLIGNDYVWPRRTNDQVKKFVAQAGGRIAAEEYVPFGAPNKFEEVVTRIRTAKPDAVVVTLVGADNVNFNRTFAGFGLAKDITRLALLLEENTLLGIGAENSAGLFSCMGYFANDPSAANKQFRAAYTAKHGEKAPQLATIGVDCYAGLNFAKALFEKAGSADSKKLMAASEGLSFQTASGRATMRGRHVDKDMFLAECKGTEFSVVRKLDAVPSGTECKT